MSRPGRSSRSRNHADAVDVDIGGEQKAKTSRKGIGGKPTTYRPEYAAIAENACRLYGATDMELAELLGTGWRSIYRWAAKYPEFRQALKAGKDPADDRVERSLYLKAVGYSHEAVKIFMVKETVIRKGKPVTTSKPVIVPYIEHLPPSDVAAIFWLKNRRPNEWKMDSDAGSGGGHGQASDLAKQVREAQREAEASVPAPEDEDQVPSTADAAAAADETVPEQ